jgi:GTPase SAR1 family protein
MKNKEGLLYKKMKGFISIINELRDRGLQSYVNLPSIVVVGLQSAGKSSLLEAIVGIDFLPRGSGVVTRRPLELRMVNSPGEKKAYGVFDKVDKKKKYYNFEDVKRMIDKLTDEVAGTSKEIIDDPIVLTVYSPTCPDLNIVDLPGITKVPVKGSNQTHDIEKITTDLISKYIKDPRSVILCVSQASVDISTSDALKLASKFDPDSNRTLCVLTKVDLVGRGHDIRSILRNEEVSLKYGFVTVKGRSKEDMDNEMTIQQGLRAEIEFFEEVYPDLLNDNVLGTSSLVDRLSKILGKNITESLPQITKEIRSKVEVYDRKLEQLGQPLPESDKEKENMIQKHVNQFVEGYISVVKGKYSKVNKNDDDQPIGVKIRLKLNKVFQEIDKEAMEKKLSEKVIKSAFINFSESGLTGFPSYSAFQSLLKPFLDELVPRSKDLVEEIYGLLEVCVKDIISKVFLRFPEVSLIIENLALENIQRCKEEAETLVQQMMEAELCFFYTTDKEYLQYHGSILPPEEEKDNVSDMSDSFIKEIRQRVIRYFNLIYRNLRDCIPKIIGQMLLHESHASMNQALYEGLRNEFQQIAENLREPEGMKIQREQINKARDILRRCLKTLEREDLFEADDDDY